MEAETKTCQSCSRSFVVSEADKGFFEKLGVGAPDLCHRCGTRLFMSMRNERVLYRRACDKCRKDTLSLYHPDANYVVYCHDCWWKDDWDGTDYAMPYDPSRSFMDQFKELQRKVPREALIILNSQQCDYGNNVRDSKNCYFGILVSDSENVFYSMWVANGTRDCIGSRKVVASELVAYCRDISRCNNCTFLRDSSECTDCHWSFDLRGCSNCILCTNLRNRSYCIRNQQLTKEEYEKEAKRLLGGSFLQQENLQREYETLKAASLHRFASILKSERVAGNYIQGSSDCVDCFDVVDCQHMKAVTNVLNCKESMYCYAIGTQPTEFLYGSSVIKGGSNIKFSFNLFNCSDCTWCDSLISSSHCVGSIGIKRKEYCILNTQYSKEDFQKIAKELLARGELRQLPPPDFSAFAYNETAAQEHYPLTQEEAIRQGFSWQDDIPFTKGKETMRLEEIPDNITDVQDSILEEILECSRCKRNYRIIKDELDYYRRFHLALPRICPQCRLQVMYDERLPLKLWQRRCQCDGSSSNDGTLINTAAHFHAAAACPSQFETPYAPDRPEIVYCEQYYQAEVA